MRALKRLLFRLLRKDPDAVVLTFLSGNAERGARMFAEVRSLLPERRHYAAYVGPPPIDLTGAEGIALAPASPWGLARQVRRRLPRARIGLAPLLLARDPLAWAALLVAPRKLLAYNARGERHHPRLRTAISSLLFLRGVPLDRIFLRPWWWPFRRERSTLNAVPRVWAGRPTAIERPRIAILTPYLPYPLSHGGAVRMHALLREAARDFDIHLFAFGEAPAEEDLRVLQALCAQVTLFGMPRYREPRWSSLTPPEACEFRSAAVREAVRRLCHEARVELLQVEYTQLGTYPGDLLVEHDVTFDLYRQMHARQPTLASWWDLRRWFWFERAAVRRYRRVVTMSDKDAGLLPGARCATLPNGVDLGRFQPAPEPPGQRVLFVGSFRHFPNITACRFFLEEVWPRLRNRLPEARLSLVAGPDPELYWQAHTDAPFPAGDPHIELHGFVRDVVPLYAACHVVVVPTTVSAGTNLKVLEAMAMQRAIVSTSSGCAGLGLTHGESVWVADEPAAFADAVATLLTDAPLRQRLALAARAHAEAHYGWRELGRRQSALWRELLAQRSEGAWR